MHTSDALRLIKKMHKSGQAIVLEDGNVFVNCSWYYAEYKVIGGCPIRTDIGYFNKV